jgi:O-antigen/teichoic acid export membrane protein
MNGITLLLVVTKTVTLILGALITCFAYRAFRRQGIPALRALTTGFGLVTVGSAAGGLLYHIGDVGFTMGVAAESLITATGFAVLVYSLYATTDADIGSSAPFGADSTASGEH